MLDDLNIIKQRDPQDFLGFAATQPKQLTHDFGIAKNASLRPVKNVAYAGMGGSALAAELLRTFPALKVPFVISKEYNLPTFVGEDTLVICASYSGNTEETLDALQAARQAGAQIAIITHGGKLLDNAKEHGDVLAQIPPCLQPRASTFYMYRAAAEILVAAKLAKPDVLATLEALVPSLTQAVVAWGPEIPEAHNPTKQMAQKMVGKTAVIYAGPKMYPAAYKWKISVNENAKNTAWCNFLPEFNHNEFLGWSGHPIDKPFAVFDLISSFEHPRVIKRFEVTDRLLSGMRPASINIEARGASLEEHMLYLVLLGDFTTTYLAYLNGVNPAPVELVEKFKNELA